MIKITGNAIELKQGDSGAVRFFFKDKQTDFPYILEKFDEDYTSIDNNIPQSAIKFIVRQDPSDSSKAVIERYYMLDNKAENDIDFYRFNSNVIVADPGTGYKTDTLYYRQAAKDPNGWEFFFYKVEGGSEIPYDYINSSINIVFKTEDTKNLFYKTYYYEIAYIEGTNLAIEGTNLDKDKENITLKHTLIESTPFVVTGALVK